MWQAIKGISFLDSIHGWGRGKMLVRSRPTGPGIRDCWACSLQMLSYFAIFQSAAFLSRMVGTWLWLWGRCSRYTLPPRCLHAQPATVWSSWVRRWRTITSDGDDNTQVNEVSARVVLSSQSKDWTHANLWNTTIWIHCLVVNLNEACVMSLFQLFSDYVLQPSATWHQFPKYNECILWKVNDEQWWGASTGQVSTLQLSISYHFSRLDNYHYYYYYYITYLLLYITYY